MRRIVYVLLLAALAVLAFGQPRAATSDVISRAGAMMEAGDYAGAIALLEAEATAGPERSYSLADAYFLRATIGREVADADPDDITQALHHAREALKRGNVHAYNLLHMIHEVEGLPSFDLQKAAEYLRLGAEAGESGAMLNYATELYYGSSEIPRDRERVCPLVDKLLEDEQVQALITHVAGLILVNGECGKQPDARGGIAMIRIAASRGFVLSQYDLALALNQGIGVERDEEEALAWFQKVADRGHGPSLWYLGMAHVEGQHRPRDARQAVRYFEQSADAGHPDGMVSLAVMYASGDGVAQDYAKALDLYTRAADLGHSHAYRGLAVMLALGQGTAVDRVQARVHYLQALALGDLEDPPLREVIESAMTAEEIRESDDRFEQWKERQAAVERDGSGSAPG